MHTAILRFAAIGLLLLLAGAGSAAALDAPPAVALNLGPDGVALAGHDPVAYFAQQRAVAGDPAITLEHAGAIYRFASAANRDAFAARPEAYLPQYGGYCAFGAAHGGKFDIDPTQFRVVEGKLYLNKNAAVSRRWQQDINGNIRAADRQWPAIRDRAAQELR